MTLSQNRKRHQKPLMKFLKTLAETPLPTMIHQPELIDQVRSYVSAGLITANLPDEPRTRVPDKAPAEVLNITAEGKRVLKKYLRRPGWC
jgi:hypothetical protein